MRGKMLSGLFGILYTLLAATFTPVHADAVITFANKGAFDGDVAGAGQVGASQVYTDLANGSSATLTTQAINGNTVPSSNRETRVTNAGNLGINNAEFTSGTSWTVDFSGDTYFKGVALAGFRSGKLFTIESTAWSALSITPGSANVSFSAGKFTLNGAQPLDTFTLFDLTGAAGNVLFVSAGTDITFASLTGAEALTNFTVAIPEPSSFVLVGVAAGGLALVRRRMNKTAKPVDVA